MTRIKDDYTDDRFTEEIRVVTTDTAKCTPEQKHTFEQIASILGEPTSVGGFNYEISLWYESFSFTITADGHVESMAIYNPRNWQVLVAEIQAALNS